MSDLACRVIRGLQRRSRTVRGCLRRWSFILEAKIWLKEFSLGEGGCLSAPTVIRGGRGTLHIGDNVSLGYWMSHRQGDGTILVQPRGPNAVIIIGDGTIINNNTALVAMGSIRIGTDCRIGDSVAIYDCDFHEIDPILRNRGPGPNMPVEIGDNVWLGSRVMVLKGVTIGANSVVGAGSIVTTSLPANCVAAGVPARVIRTVDGRV